MNVPYMSLEHVHMPLQCFFSMEGKGAVTLAHFFNRLLRVQKCFTKEQIKIADYLKVQVKFCSTFLLFAYRNNHDNF